MTHQNPSAVDAIVLNEDDFRITIKDLSFQSNEVWNYLKDIPNQDLKDRVGQALIVGATTLRRVNLNYDFEYLDRRTDIAFNELQLGILKYVHERVADPENKKSVSSKILRIFDAQNLELKGLLSRNESSISEIDKSIENFKKTMSEELINTVGKSISNDTGLSQRFDQLNTEIKELKEEILKKDTIANSSANQIGLNFEESVLEKIYQFTKSVQTLAGPAVVEDVRAVTGVLGGKQGDFVITLGKSGQYKIVVEVKATKSSTVPKIITNLDESLKNRNADLAILVGIDETTLPSEVGGWSQLSDNKIVSSFSILPMTLKLGLSQLLIHSESQEDSESVDIEAAMDRVKEIQLSLKGFSKLTTSHRRTVDAAEQSMKIGKDIRDSIGQSCEDLLSILQNNSSEATKAA